MDRLVRHAYSILLGSLLTVLVASPIIAAVGMDGNLVEFLLFASLATVALGAATTKQRRWLLAILACAAAVRLFGRFQRVEAASAVGAVIWIIVAGLAAIKAFRFALSGGDIDKEHICAALSVYMLAGHLYGFAYWRLEHFIPGSFASGGVVLPPGQFDLPTAIYLSFVVIATVGFGDIVPVTTLARGLVMTEAVLGQFYMVVLVARLVSLYSQNAGTKKE